MFQTVTIPTIHPTSESRQLLRENYLQAFSAVQTALEKLYATEPNPVNYETRDEVRAASHEHTHRVGSLATVEQALSDIILGIDKLKR